MLEFLAAPIPKWSAGRSKNQAPYLIARSTDEALEYRRVLGIDWHDFAACLTSGVRHQLSRNNERLLISERNTLSGSQGSECCVQSSSANDGVQYD